MVDFSKMFSDAQREIRRRLPMDPPPRTVATICTTDIVGMHLEERQDIAGKSAKEGALVYLQRESGNPHDPNAVMVLDRWKHQLGYLSRGVAATVAPLMDDPETQTEARVVRWRLGWAPEGREEPYEIEIRVTLTQHALEGWYPDPRGSYENRYWSGSAWTERVETAGVNYEDPV